MNPKITKIAFFCYAVTNIKKSRQFYEGFLGLTSNSEYPAKDDVYFIEYDIDGVTLSIGASPDWPTSQDGASVAFEVDNLEEWVVKAKENNIPIKNGPHDFPGCKMVVITDPDKNPLVLHQKK